MSACLQLGDLLALGQKSSAQLSAWLRASNASLSERVEREAALRSETLAQFVRIAVSDFLAEADEEAGASLMSALRDAPDPGGACVARMAAFRLQREGAQ